MTIPAAPAVDISICSGCGRCVSACPLRLITLEVAGFRKNAVVTNPGLCTGCCACVRICVLKALTEPANGRGDEEK